MLCARADLYISAHMQPISRGASSKLEYVLEHWLIYVNMIKSPLCGEEWVIDIGSFNIMLTPSDISLVWEKQLSQYLMLHRIIFRLKMNE